MKKLISKTVLPLLAVFLLAVALATSCEKDKNENALTVSGVSFTPCHGEGDKSFENPDSVAVTISDKTVYVTHYNLDVNCGWQDIDVQPLQRLGLYKRNRDNPCGGQLLM